MLAELHDRAPVHGWEASRAAIEGAFGRPVGELFDEIDHAPLASGSIAQACRRTALRSKSCTSFWQRVRVLLHMFQQRMELRSTRFAVCMYKL